MTYIVADDSVDGVAKVSMNLKMEMLLKLLMRWIGWRN
jgi:hypothetical protein